MHDFLDNLIQRCIARNKKPKIAHPTRYTRHGYSIYYASRDGKLQAATPKDFEAARLGIIPIAKNGHPIEQYAASVKKDWKTRYGFDDWEKRSWKQSYGIQVYTGIPSEYITELDFEYDIVRDHPQALLETLDALLKLIQCPLITISKSGGIRFTGRTPNYIHPRNNEAREYIAKYNQETGNKDALYLEIFGDKGLSRWDARYEIITGDLFNLPVVEDVDALFEIIDNLKSKIHLPAPPKQEKSQQKQQSQTKNKKKQRTTDDVQIIDGLPSDIEWIPTGEKDKYKSKRGNYPCNFTKHTKSHGSAQYYKDTQTSGINGFCHNCRELWWVAKPKKNRTAPDRLHIANHHRPTAAYQETQADMTQKLLNWEETTRDKEGQHLLNIITPAQTGKTRVSIITVDKLTYITSTEDKATEAYMEAVGAGKDAYLHKSRMFNRSHEHWEDLPLGTDEASRPCIEPDTCNQIAAKGFSAAKEFCAPQCPQYELCREVGFLSQQHKEQSIDHVFYWQGEALFSDEVYQSRVKAVMGDRNAILAIDEPNPADLPQLRIIDTQALRQLFNNIKYMTDTEDMATVLKNIVEGLSTAETPEDIRTAFSDAIKTLSEAEIKDFDEKLSGIPVGFVWHRDPAAGLYATVIYNDQTRTCFVTDDDDETIGTIPQSILSDGVTLDKLETRFIGLTLYQRLGFVNVRQETEHIPRVYRKLIADIKQFVDSGRIACHRIDTSTIAFYLPPSLNARRGITLNASDTDNLIGHVYKDTPVNVDVITANPPPWKSGCQILQIRTGRYPPGNLFLYKQRKKKKRKKKVIGITKTMHDLINIILNTAEKYDVLVIGPKHLQNKKIDPRIKQLNVHQNITLDTHKGAQGKNKYQDRDVVFVFCFEPQPDIVKEQATRIYPNARDLCFDREMTDRVVDGITLKDVMRYKDERVQKVYDLLCEKAIMQAIYRLRQARNENKIAILLSAEPISQIPVTPVPFRKEQLLKFMERPDWQLSELVDYLNTEEQRMPKDIAEAEGVSIRTAYYKSEPTRAQTKAEKKKRAKELDGKVPVEQIIAELNISRPTFYRWKANNFE